jgi:hypothetical protein
MGGWCIISASRSINSQHKGIRMKKAQDIAGRIVAVFLSSALAIVGGSAVLAPELAIWKSAVLAGFAACATVVQKLAQSSLDGKLTLEEINSAFGAKAEK